MWEPWKTSPSNESGTRRGKKDSELSREQAGPEDWLEQQTAFSIISQNFFNTAPPLLVWTKIATENLKHCIRN